MSIRYVCRHCQYPIGQIDDMLVSEEQLGFDQLSKEEREAMIHYQENGDIIAHVICDHCQEAIDRHPELSLQSRILQ